ncbi:MAG: tetratricopeptide repeat protein [Deltaproteobacteria bacterium]|nr:tetratricopeptide repeat protein [Deltaproteobacteria bacterium]
MFFVAWLASAWALAPEVEESERLANAGDLDGTIRVLEDYIAKSPDDPEALWRLARALYEKGEVLAQSVPDAQRLPIYTRVRSLSRRVQELDPEAGFGYLWEGVAMGRIATSKGILSQLSTADDIERLWLRSLQSKTVYRMDSGISSFPGDAWNALGQFYRLCPDWKAMEWISGTRGDIDKSVSYFRLMVKDDPNRLEGLKELGVALLCKGYKQDDDAAKVEGRVWLARAYALPATYPTDVIDHKQIPVIKSREADACGYSRDGWEKLDEAAYAGR